MSAGDPCRSRARCLVCGERRPARGDETRCGCGGLLDIEHPRPDAAPAELRARFAARRAALRGLDASGVWRFRELVDPKLAPRHVITLAEGRAVPVESETLAAWCGLERLLIQHEGWNPTGSFKDRGMTVAVSRARAAGARWLACASTGNTAASLAAYGARAGLAVRVFVPRGRVARAKLAQTEAQGAEIVELAGDFDAALRAAEERANAEGGALLNSLSPWRVEGQKSIAFSLLEALDWDPPEWIALPAGNLGNTAALGKALVEARDLGLIDRLPRLACVQAAGAAPFAAAFERGFDRLVPVRAETRASAIRIGDPASYPRAVRAIRATQGVVLALPDETLLDAFHAAARAGLGAELASCAALAGARELVRRGLAGARASLACLFTGHLLKQPRPGPDTGAP